MKDLLAKSLIDYIARINQSLDEGIILDNALDSLISWPGIDAAWVYLCTPTYELHGAAGRVKKAVMLHAIDVDEIAACAFGGGEPGTAPLPGHPSGLQGIATFPLMNGDKGIGALILGCLTCHFGDLFGYTGEEAEGARDETWENGEPLVFEPGLMEILPGVAGSLATAILNARQYWQTRQTRDRLVALHMTLTHIQSIVSLHDKMQSIANALHNMGWEHVTLWLCDEGLKVSDVVYAGISFQEEVRLRQSLPPGVEVYRLSREDLEPYQIGSCYLVTKEDRYPYVAWRPDDAVYAPLYSTEPDLHTRRLMGSIELRYPTDGLRPDKEQLSIVELFASEAVHEIARSHQADLQRQQLHDLSVLYETGAAFFSHQEEGAIQALLNRALCDATRATSASFAELDLERLVARRVACYHTPTATPDEQALLSPNSTYPLTPELVERVIKTRLPYVVRSEERSLLYLPVSLGEQILGMVEISDRRAERSFPERQLALCRATVNQAAISLSYAQLYHRTDIERSRLRAILESSYDGIALISPDGIIMDLNGAVCRLLRLTCEPEDWRGRSLMDLLLELRRHTRSAARAAWREFRRIRRGDHSPGQGDFEVRDGSTLFIRYIIYPIQATSLKVTGWLLWLHDATEEQALVRTREEMTHMLVHDLRGPLTAIISATKLLSMGSLGKLPDDQRAMLDMVQRNSASMHDMINTILDMAQLEAGQMPLNRQPIPPAVLISKAVEALAPAANERQLRLFVELPPDLPDAWADRRVIERVINNLVNNAIKFTPAGGKIVLAVHLEEAYLVVSVADTGPGVEPDLRDRLFQKFAVGQAEERGSGLGLAFCKLAIEAHGGRIWVESPLPSLPEGQGPGSVFFFTLPVAT